VHVGINARGEAWVAMDGLDGERAAARALYDRNQIDDARAAYLALVQRAPDDAAVLGDAGTFFFKTGAYAAAQTAFERAVARAPESVRAHVSLGNVCFARGAFVVRDRARPRP
jgi:predicted Zn-dependent protease